MNVSFDTSANGLFEVQADLTEAMQRATLAVARDAAVRAKRTVPVDTGALRESIRAEKHDNSAARVTAGGGGVINPRKGTVVDYAAAVEYGENPTGEGFLRNAVMNARAALDRMGGEVTAAMARAARRRLGYTIARTRGATAPGARRARDTRQRRVVQP